MSDEVEVIRAEVAPVVAQALTLGVANAAEYSAASEFLKNCKGAQAKVVAFFAPMKQKAHEAHKAITTQESATLKPLQEAEATVKRNMLTYYTEQERIRAEAQRRAQAIIDEAARRERAKADEAARIQREREQVALRAEVEARERAAAATNEAERAKAEAEAAKARAAAALAAERASVKEEASAAVVAPVAVVASAAPVVSGIGIRKTWTAKVVNLALVPREFMAVNEKALDAFAKATKGGVPVAGVEFVEVSSMASSAR